MNLSSVTSLTTKPLSVLKYPYVYIVLCVVLVTRNKHPTINVRADANKQSLIVTHYPECYISLVMVHGEKFISNSRCSKYKIIPPNKQLLPSTIFLRYWAQIHFYGKLKHPRCCTHTGKHATNRLTA